MPNNYPLTSLQNELAKSEIQKKRTGEEEREEHEFREWEKQQEKKSNNQLIRSVLIKAGIDPNGDIHEQLQNY